VKLLASLLRSLNPRSPKEKTTMANTDILSLIAEAEALVASIKADFADGKLSLKEILALIGAAAKLATHAAGLL
jgi:hypothetical protein